MKQSKELPVVDVHDNVVDGLHDLCRESATLALKKKSNSINMNIYRYFCIILSVLYNKSNMVKTSWTNSTLCNISDMTNKDLYIKNRNTNCVVKLSEKSCTLFIVYNIK